MSAQPSSNDYISWFENLSKGDVARVGGKNASLGEMVQRLASQGVHVQEGFATTSGAYRAYVEANAIGSARAARMEALKRGAATLHATGEAARRLFLDGEFPAPIAQAMLKVVRGAQVLELSVTVGKRPASPRARDWGIRNRPEQRQARACTTT